MIKALKGIIKLKCKIVVLTGLHIGGSKENVEIGGIDNIVIKIPALKLDDEIEKDVPYIPGSSIKGKMRALLEWVEKPVLDNDKPAFEVIALTKWGNKDIGEPCNCGKCKVCKLFGAHKNTKSEEPVRLRIEDFYPTKETIKMWRNFLDGDFVEVKVENTIDRVKGTAQHPRYQERVIPFSEFEGEIKIRVHEGDKKDLYDTVQKGIRLIEDDYLGGSGSRGYGKVKFEIKEILWTDCTKDKIEDVPINLQNPADLEKIFGVKSD
jgi:CRISPR-associated protein Csm3